MTVLLSCPFCGGAATVRPDEVGSGGQHVGPYWAGCPMPWGCGVVFQGDDPEEATEAWNRRAYREARPFLPDSREERAAEKERLRFEGDLDRWMKLLGAGITGYQPEAYAVMDAACAELVRARARLAAIEAQVPEGERASDTSGVLADRLRGLMRMSASSDDSFNHLTPAALRLLTEVHASLSERALTTAQHDVLSERRRQVEAEGWTPEHDKMHTQSQLSRAAACYASAAFFDPGKKRFIPIAWPWEARWWKPAGPRRMLVKAAALILAEIERLDRARARQGGNNG